MPVEFKEIHECRAFAESVMEASPSPLVVLDGALRVVSANRAFFRRFGTAEGELAGRPFLETAGGRWDVPALRRALEACAREGEAFSGLALERALPGGGRLDVSVNGRRAVNGLVLVAVEDRSAENSRRVLDAILENIPEGLSLLDARTMTVSRVSGLIAGLVGIPAEQLAGLPLDEYFKKLGIGGENGEPYERLQDTPVFRVLTGGEPVLEMDASLAPPGKKRLLVRISIAPVRDEWGAIVYGVVSWRDITARRQAEEALRESEEQYRTLVEASPEGITCTDLEGRIRYANRKTAEIHGYDDPGELRGVSAFSLIAPEDRGRAEGNLRKTFASGIPETFEYTFLRRDGSRFPAELSTRVVRDGRGEPAGFMALSRDITCRKEAEQALRESEEKYRTLVERANDGIIIVQDGVLQFANRKMAQLDGSTVEELIGSSFNDHVHPPEIPKMAEIYRRRMAGEAVPSTYETVLRRRSGEPAPAEINAAVITFRGRPADLVVIRDISGRKRAEEALRASELSFIEAFRTSPAVTAISRRKDGRIVEVNRAFEEASGYSRDEVVGKTSRELGLYSPYRQREELLVELARAGEVRDRELIFRGKGGRTMIGLASLITLSFRGEPCLLFAGIDITARKEAEEALRKTEAEFRALAEHSPDIIVRYDRECRFRYVNPKAPAVFGHPREEIIGKRNIELGMPRQGADYWEALIREVFTTRREKTIEFDFPPGQRFFDARLVPELDEKGRVSSVLSIARDITPLKEAERRLMDALKETEKRREEAQEGKSILEAVLEHIPEGLSLVDARTDRVRAISRYSADFTGFSREEIAGVTLQEYTERLKPKKVSGEPVTLEEMPIWRSVHRGETAMDEEYRLMDKAGESFTILVNTTPIRDAQGKVTGGLSVWRNIEPLLKTQEALRVREAQLNAFFESAPGILQLLDGNLCFINTDPNTPVYLGLNRETIKGKCLEQIFPGNEREYMEMARRVMETGEPRLNVEGQNRVLSRPDEMVFWRLSYFRVPLGGGKWGLGVLGIDITDMKKTEEAMRRNQYELRTLVDNSPDLIFRVNSGMRYVYVNPAYERVTGILRERFIGRTNSELGMQGEMVELWRSSLRKVVESGRELSLDFDLAGLFGKRYFSARLIPEFGRMGVVETVLVIARDVTERRIAEERVRYISFHDEVTKLFNRAYFEEELKRLDTGRNLPISVIMGDINNLKLTNDVFGHQEGDALLKTIAGILRKACRRSDVIARWGGDEFAVILPGTPLATVRNEIFPRIMQIERETGGTAIAPSIALGAAAKERPDQNIYRILRRAEEQMYAHKTAESRRNAEGLISLLSERAVERNKGMKAHLERCRALAEKFGGELGLSGGQKEDLYLLFTFHDIGDAVIPQSLLSKPGRLTMQEWMEVKKHAEAGFMILKSLAETAKIADEVLSHQERWDGTGYPRGLSGARIPYLARIFAVVDAYDVMTHPRPYERAFTREEALGELERGAGRQFDPELVKRFLRMARGEAPAATAGGA